MPNPPNPARQADTLTSCVLSGEGSAPRCREGRTLEILDGGRYRMRACEACGGTGLMTRAASVEWERKRRATV